MMGDSAAEDFAHGHSKTSDCAMRVIGEAIAAPTPTAIDLNTQTNMLTRTEVGRNFPAGDDGECDGVGSGIGDPRDPTSEFTC